MSNITYEFRNADLRKINTSLLYVSHSIYEGDWFSVLHSHPFTELFYVVKGRGHFQINNKTFDVKEDDLVIVNANVSHTEYSIDSNPLEYIVLGIEGMAILQDIKDGDDSYGEYSILNYRGYKDEVLFYLKKLLKEAREKDELYKEVTHNLLLLLIINIVRRTSTRLVISSTENISKECAYIKNYIDNNYSSNITLDSLSEMTHMSRFYLVHIFRRFFNVSPISYLITKRLKEAAHLLESTDLSIMNISSSVGFTNQSYFCQIFKKNYNMSPSSYRKLNKIKASS
ncbi:AraC family transcriptional regulator [Alloiococcus sp. CFN-8]|uniref:AraC family transcriptional regulator n=1 Tax=Alloiococcus sp. CFN-8 TaxID=3416081 RepID=UPI003CF6917F